MTLTSVSDCQQSAGAVCRRRRARGRASGHRALRLFAYFIRNALLPAIEYYYYFIRKGRVARTLNWLYTLFDFFVFKCLAGRLRRREPGGCKKAKAGVYSVPRSELGNLQRAHVVL